MSEALTVIVGTVGKAHGLKGEVSLILRTDVPEARLFEGATVTVDADPVDSSSGASIPPVLTVAGTRVQQDRWYARFVEVANRSAAEALRGANLTVDVDRDEEFDEDPDAWYPEELKGLAVVTESGTALGTVVDLVHYPAQDQLIVKALDGRRVMLPFVEELVPEVDIEAGRVVADPPGGLFDPDNAVSERDTTEE